MKGDLLWYAKLMPNTTSKHFMQFSTSSYKSDTCNGTLHVYQSYPGSSEACCLLSALAPNAKFLETSTAIARNMVEAYPHLG